MYRVERIGQEVVILDDNNQERGRFCTAIDLANKLAETMEKLDARLPTTAVEDYCI